MRAMFIHKITDLQQERKPLELRDIPKPLPGPGEVLVEVSACGVCHTELDEIEGRTPPPVLPVVPGHQVVGRVVELGSNANRLKIDQRVGVAWIYSACGRCEYCKRAKENLCISFRATGRDVNGGYAQYMVVSQDFAHPIPKAISDYEAAPLLCAGAVGYRALRLTGLQDGQALGLTGFGASNHLVLMAARYLYPHTPIYVFARSDQERHFALQLGAAWTGDAVETPPVKLDAIIDTTPVWKPVVEALRVLAPGGRLVVNAIRKEDLDKDYLLKLDYSTHLWQEKEIKSVANVTRRDVREFLELAVKIPIKPEVQVYPLEEANQALLEMKESKIRGAKVLKVN
jgi:propanol-preferring alcohol dehydrogenase